MLNQFLSERFAIGVHLYTYQQLTGDSGNLGSYMGESFGLGPQLLWRPKFFGEHITLMASWIRDLSATNRLESDYGIVQVVFMP